MYGAINSSSRRAGLIRSAACNTLTRVLVTKSHTLLNIRRPPTVDGLQALPSDLFLYSSGPHTAIFAMFAKQPSLLVLLLLSTGLYAQNLTLSSATTNSTSVSLAPVTMHVSTTITINTTAAISVTQTTSTGDIFKFVTVNINLNLGYAFTPRPTSPPSTITLPPSLSSAYTKCHNNCTVYPVDGLSWSWIAIPVNESVTLATEFIIIDASRNMTSTSTKYDTELLSKYPLPTDTNSAGTKTSAIAIEDYYAGTPVYVTL